MKVKKGTGELMIKPFPNGWVVTPYSYAQGDTVGSMIEQSRVFNDIKDLQDYLFEYYVDVDGTLLEKARQVE